VLTGMMVKNDMTVAAELEKKNPSFPWE